MDHPKDHSLFGLELPGDLLNRTFNNFDSQTASFIKFVRSVYSCCCYSTIPLSQGYFFSRSTSQFFLVYIGLWCLIRHEILQVTHCSWLEVLYNLKPWDAKTPPPVTTRMMNYIFRRPGITHEIFMCDLLLGLGASRHTQNFVAQKLHVFLPLVVVTEAGPLLPVAKGHLGSMRLPHHQWQRHCEWSYSHRRECLSNKFRNGWMALPVWGFPWTGCFYRFFNQKRECCLQNDLLKSGYCIGGWPHFF